MKAKKIFKSDLARRITGFLFLIPSAVFILFSLIIPTIENVILSFHKWDGFNPREFIFFNNYIKMFNDSGVHKNLYNSIYIALGITFFSVLIGLFLAAIIYRLGKNEGAFYKLIFFMPVMLPLSIIGLLFTFMYNPEMGLINQMLRLVGLDSLTKAWLENYSTVMPSLIVVGIWRMMGLTMMLCFAAMQMIPDSLIESSKLDGARYIRQFFYIILPLIKPTIKLSAIFTLAISFKTYDLVVIITGGGPAGFTKTVPLQMIDTGFGYNEFGYAASMGFTLSIIVMAIIYIVSKILGGEQYEY